MAFTAVSPWSPDLTGIDPKDPANAAILAGQVLPGTPAFAAQRAAREAGIDPNAPIVDLTGHPVAPPPTLPPEVPGLVNRQPALGTPADLQARYDAASAPIAPSPPQEGMPPGFPSPASAPNSVPPPGAPRDNPLHGLDEATSAAQAQARAQAAALANVGPEVKETYARQTRNEPALQKQLDAAEGSERTAAGKASDTKIGNARDQVTQAQAEADAIAKANADAQAAQKRSQDAYDAGQKELDQQRQTTIKNGARTYWEDKSTGSTVLSALMAGLGQFASALTGGPNAALGVINAAVDRDAQTKREKTRAELERLGIKGHELERRLTLADVEIQNGKSAALESLAAQRAIRQAKAGVGQAEAEKDVLQAGLLRQSAAEKLKAEQGLRHLVTVDTGPQVKARTAALVALAGAVDKPIGAKETTADEKAKDAFLQRATGEAKRLVKMDGYSDKDLRELERWRAKVSEVGDTSAEKFFANLSSISGDVRKRLSPQGRARFEAEQGWASAILRPESGAAISGGEYLQKLGGIQKTKGDTPEIMREKANRLLEQMAGVAGQTYRPKYWSDQLHQLSGDAPARLSPQQIAALNVALRTASPEDATRIRAALAGAR